MSQSIIGQIDQDTLKRYNRRLEKFGYDPMSLGWDNKENQFVRFNAALDLVDVSGADVLDLGCGFGDFLAAIRARGQKPKSYIGIDINDKLIEVARNVYPDTVFETHNLLTTPYNRKHDFVFMNGVLNFNLKNNGLDNYEYAMDFIRKAWDVCKKGLVVDMLSTHLADNYPPEDIVFYYSPEKIFEFSQSLTHDVVLKHDYRPIPQKEFMLFLKKS